ncbi:nitroreductase/NAD-dependent dihydropyrimidine dehydrogenase PreA subunit [Paenibacillus forsythiae]|uniref:Nitroreductase/NAD-dependent dihydropyrimidine dehydrogenase PreA subunit n=1 Tax=Paenibacillus forsythiae TaxID=365616 RepID=A0ABU3H7B4_9BACL|nr:nitroreductase family protein [Paenibacillus forsythiae]MDT3426708.1 nitroreductase/NAD-dependent dihydropyrimidine dehydrogenase PreA subunit [Paenibacillus forsythiae]
MGLITVDQEECIQCAICVEECPTRALTMGEYGPEATAAAACMECGHCVAVCPNEAIDHSLTPLAGQISITGYDKLNEAEAERFLRSRRSIRSYRKTAVPREKLLQLVEIARFAPTGGNTQGISYVIVEDKETLRKASEMTIQKLENDPVLGARYSSIVDAFRNQGTDVILRDAPSLILTTAAKDFKNGRENSIFSLTYLELFAPSLGLGSCWAGGLEFCALGEDSPMLELFHIPEDKVITGAVMVGYPKYQYHRLVDRNPLDVAFFSPEKITV